MDSQYMQLAIDEARKAKNAGDLPFGAVIVCRNEVVGRGRVENNSGGDVTTHAELQALRDACKTLKKNILNECIIYCTNEPCAMCAAGIFQAKIATVIIGASRNDLPQLLRSRKLGIDDLADDSGYQITIQKGVLKEKVLDLFTDIHKS